MELGWDETLYRLQQWRKGQGASERLAAQLLLASGFESVDPRHPYGGPDSGVDALARRGGQLWIMAVHFPRRPPSFNSLLAKFRHDAMALAETRAVGIAFVTNQELKYSQRTALQKIVEPAMSEIYHLDRVATILDEPRMHGVREQFLGIRSSLNDEWAGVYSAPSMPKGWPKVFVPEEDDESFEYYRADPNGFSWKLPRTCVCEFGFENDDPDVLGWGDGREALEGAIPNGLAHQDLLNPIVWHWLNLLWDVAQELVGEAPAAFEAREDWFRDKREIREFVQAMEAAQAEFEYFHPEDNELVWHKPWL